MDGCRPLTLMAPIDAKLMFGPFGPKTTAPVAQQNEPVANARRDGFGLFRVDRRLDQLLAKNGHLQPMFWPCTPWQSSDRYVWLSSDLMLNT